MKKTQTTSDNHNRWAKLIVNVQEDEDEKKMRTNSPHQTALGIHPSKSETFFPELFIRQTDWLTTIDNLAVWWSSNEMSINDYNNKSNNQEDNTIIIDQQKKEKKNEKEQTKCKAMRTKKKKGTNEHRPFDVGLMNHHIA